jgi:NAD(P)-dependent dehydrogenase (short-subunit alcohol dehydrogenase family)
MSAQNAVVVVGCGSGCGRAIAEEFAQFTSQSSSSPLDIFTVSRSEAPIQGVKAHIRGDAADPNTYTKLREASRDHTVIAVVCSVWGADDAVDFSHPFAETDTFALSARLSVLHNRHACHVLSAHFAANASPSCSFITVTDGDTFHYRGDLLYDYAKTSLLRLVLSLSLQPPRIAGEEHFCVAVTPGFLRSEAMLKAMGVTEDTYTAAADVDFVNCSETPHFLARLLARLIVDKRSMRELNGMATSSWSLSERYEDVVDVDGRRPHWGRYFTSKYGRVTTPDARFYAEHFVDGYYKKAMERNAEKKVEEV